jgi:hypothetical protein
VFNVDRDFGLQLYYNRNIGSSYYVFRGAISSGEGRNVTSSDNGLAYTGRLEFLPFGKFTNGGDFFEGDLMREKSPKISVGATWSGNYNTLRTGGQLGKFLYEPRDMETLTVNDLGDERYIFVGHGENYQGSYLFKSNFEIVGRYSRVMPATSIRSLEEQIGQYTVGFNKYIRGHRVKLQGDLTYETNTWLQPAGNDLNRWQLRFQVEAGI